MKHIDDALVDRIQPDVCRAFCLWCVQHVLHLLDDDVRGWLSAEVPPAGQSWLWTICDKRRLEGMSPEQRNAFYSATWALFGEPRGAAQNIAHDIATLMPDYASAYESYRKKLLEMAGLEDE